MKRTGRRRDVRELWGTDFVLPREEEVRGRMKKRRFRKGGGGQEEERVREGRGMPA